MSHCATTGYTTDMDELTFVNSLEDVFQNKGYLTTREVAAGYGRADLVIGKLNDDHCSIRVKNQQKALLLKEKYFEVLRNLPDIDHDAEPLHIAELIDRITFSDRYLKAHVIQFLEEHGYVRRVENNFLYKVNGWLPMTSEVVAIEAKLSDWRRGIFQANRYKSFADKVYLALPERSAHLVNIDMLRDLNVGLYVLKGNNQVVERVRAKKVVKPLSDKRNYVSELLWSYATQA